MNNEPDTRGNESPRVPPRRDGGQSSRVGYIIAIIVNVILLWVANNLLAWNVPFLTSDFVAVLGVLNISIGANILWFFYDAAWFRHLLQIILNILAMVVIYTFYVVFPLDIGPDIVRLVLRIAMIAMLIGLGIATIIELIRLIRPQVER
jgi:hypothetical protein